MNNVQLIGRITKDPEVKTFGKGKDSVDLCRFTLAIRDGKDAEGNERTQFISCAAWGKVVEIIEQFIKKGDMVACDGKLVNNNYERDGQMIYQTEVRVSGIYLLPNKVQEEDEPKKYRNSRK